MTIIIIILISKNTTEIDSFNLFQNKLQIICAICCLGLSKRLFSNDVDNHIYSLISFEF